MKQARAIALGQRIEHRRHLGAVDGAQHGAHHVLAQRAAGIGDRLVQQRQAVAQAAVSGLGQLHDRAVVGLDVFRRQDAGHLALDLILVQALEIELQAAAEHGHRQLLRIGGGQQELDVFRRLFQRLQQRVERRLRQHVHFVDQVDLELAARRHVLRVLDHLAHVIHAGVGRGVDLQQVDVTAGVDVQAGRALATRVGTGALLAVQRLGEDTRDGGLAHATRTGEQERMVDPATVQRIAERTDHVFLAHQLGKTLRTPLAGKHEIGHQAPVFHRMFHCS
ncbi:hypothetical protein G6F35_013668 [Rhizopus arrhizus]|nr:hypothetical protein G6F35_013668 [Rhizopus arrhizus]